jgi:hypothetical protein
MQRFISYVAVLVTATLCQAASVDDVLNAWSKSTRATSVEVNLRMRRLSPERKWETDQALSALFRFKDSPVQARFDLAGPTGEAWIQQPDGDLVETFAGQERSRKTLDGNAALATNLWLGDLPAFLLVGVKTEKMRYRFDVKLIPSETEEIRVFLYPVLKADEYRFHRLEVRLKKETMFPTELHIVWRDGRHTFFAVDAPKTDVALEDNIFRHQR